MCRPSTLSHAAELHTCSRLSEPVVPELKRDARRLNVDPLEYVRLCLHCVSNSEPGAGVRRSGLLARKL
jgi:hypothetical protein